MKKKAIVIILLAFLVGLLNLSNTAIGSDCDLYYFEVDKDKYFVNENIEVNASWELDYNPINEECYIQIRVYDSSDVLIWNSTKFNEIGLFTESWSINITQLNTLFLNYSNFLYLKFFSYYVYNEDDYSSYLETIQVEIIKRTPLCQLIGFEDRIKNGDSCIFQARFVDYLFENNSYLNNQLIIFKISSNNSIIHQRNFTTNQFGTIEIYLSSISHLNPGSNTLLFTLNNNMVYNTTEFIYQIYLERNPVLIDVVSFKEHLTPKEDLEMTLFYYYFFNNSITPLNNQSIRLVIFDNQNLTYSKIYTTDMLGLLTVRVSQELFNFEIGSNELTLNFTYNGTIYLENNKYSLNLKIDTTKQENMIISNLLIFISISIVLSLVSLTLFNKFKKERKKMLAGITIRY
ncbi:MAG: hypothetical protein ACXADU_08470 [Promethearchaeota archaeon]